MDSDIIWKHLKVAKYERLKSKELNDQCEKYPIFQFDSFIKSNLERMLNLLDSENVSDETQNLDEAMINKGGEMFMYLNTCPSQSEIKFWLKFYDLLLVGKDTYISSILLVLRKVKQASVGDGRIIAETIIKKITSQINFTSVDTTSVGESLGKEGRLVNILKRANKNGKIKILYVEFNQKIII